MTLTDSHYIATTLSNRILGGYFLGCEMSPYLMEALLDILDLSKNPNLSHDDKFLSLSSIYKVDDFTPPSSSDELSGKSHSLRS